VSGRLSAATVAFGAATALFALPIYVQLHRSPGLAEQLRLIVISQAVPTLAFLGFAWVLARFAGRWSPRYWTALTLAALWSIARLLQVRILPEFLLDTGVDLRGTDQPLWLELLVMAVVVGGSLLLAKHFNFARFLVPMGPVFLLVTAYVAFVSLSAMPAALAADTTTPSSPRSDAVFILVFDELGYDVLLKDGEIDANRFPNMRALADDSLWMTNGTSDYRETCESIPSLLVGKFVIKDRCRTFTVRDDPESLLAMLRPQFRVRVYGEALLDCKIPQDGCHGIPYLLAGRPDLALGNHFVPKFARLGALGDWLGISTGMYTFETWRDFLADVTPEQTPGSAYFVHLLLPHQPLVYDARGAFNGSPHRVFTGDEGNDALAYENYRAQTALVDRMLGQFVSRLKAAGLYERSTIAITGDHGPRTPTKLADGTELKGIAAMTPRVPLILHAPGLTPGRTDIDYQHIDFTPTILDLLKIPSATAYDGRSALQPGPPRAKIFHWGGYVYEYRYGKWVDRGGS
jgi:hypothetical protein